MLVKTVRDELNGAIINLIDYKVYLISNRIVSTVPNLVPKVILSC